MNQLDVLLRRLKKIGIELELAGNHPWIYMIKVNDKKVGKPFNAEHGFTIAYQPVKVGEELHLSNPMNKIFEKIRETLNKD